MRNASGDGCRRKNVMANGNGLGSVKKIRGEQGKCSTSNAKGCRKTCKKNVVVNGVESSRKIEQDKSRYLLFIAGQEKIIVNANQSSLCRV